MQDLLGRTVGPAPDNPSQALQVLHHLRLWNIGDPIPWATNAEPPPVTRPEPAREIRQPWEPLPLKRAA